MASTDRYIQVTGAQSGKRYLIHVDLVAEVYEKGAHVEEKATGEGLTGLTPTENTHIITKRNKMYEVLESYEQIRDALAKAV